MQRGLPATIAFLLIVAMSTTPGHVLASPPPEAIGNPVNAHPMRPVSAGAATGAGIPAGRPSAGGFPAGYATGGTPVVLNVSSPEPLTLDPALFTDTASGAMINQLFAGLARSDDATGQALPDLASSWEASGDSSVFTFTLRSGLTWSDGTPLTTGDVRHAILRALAPATQATYAYSLFVIKNGAAYNGGSLTDPELVGVTVIDATHIRFTLDHPAAIFPSIVAMPVAWPVPQAAISQWGSAWTQPGHILTSGPYHLAEWVHNDHISFTKSLTFYNAAAVQAGQVSVRLVDTGAAWPLYLQGLLDTTPLPPGVPISTDSVLGPQLLTAPQACTHYYGFNVTRAPFDNVLVRKAFIAAIDRQGFIDSLFGGVQQPTLTFTPPGVFGHVDGAAEGVGIAYDPVQAREWLAAAGYPDGAGLPPITLWYNTSSTHQAVAQAVRGNWTANLGVTVNQQSMPWSDYLQALLQGQFQVWRMSWCMDYADAYNFLADGVDFDRGGFGGWTDPQYQALLDQAIRTADPATRRGLYKQAETILVQTGAVMAPLWYGTTVAMTRPYLQRTYATNGLGYVAGWRQERAAGATVSPGSRQVFTPTVDPATVYDFPGDLFASAAAITHTAASPAALAPTGRLAGIGHNFQVEAVGVADGQPLLPAPGATYTVTIHYSPLELRQAVDESTLALYYWDGSGWQRETSSLLDTASHTVRARPGHFSSWMVLGANHQAYLPDVSR